MLQTWFVLLAFILMQSCSLVGYPESELKRNNEKNKAAIYNMQLGLAYLQMENIPRAKDKLFTALHEAPYSAEVNSALAFLMEKTGELKLAHQYYRKSIGLSINKGAYFNNYGVFLCRQKDYINAEKYLVRAAEDNRYAYSAKSYENAAKCAMKARHYAKADKYFHLALQQDPSLKQSQIGVQQLEMKQKVFLG